MDNDHFTTDSADQHSASLRHDPLVPDADAALQPADAGSQIGFDYSALDAETTAALRNAASEIREAHTEVIDAIEDIGQWLILAKDMLSHGTFTAWVAAEFGLTGRTAENYMNASRFLKGKAQCISLLPAHIIYKLAARGAPPEIVHAVEAAAEAGAPLPSKEIEGRLADAAERARNEKREIKRIATRTNSGIRRRQKLTFDQAIAEQDRKNRARERMKVERQSLLAPLVERVILALGDELLPQVLEALGDCQRQADFIDLLRRAPGGAR